MDIEFEAAVGDSPEALLAELRGWHAKPGGYSTLLLVSFGMLPVEGAPQDLWLDLKKSLLAIRNRHRAGLYHLGLGENAILLRLTEFNQVGVLSDLKIEILRLIQQYFAEHFGRIDQARLFRVVPLKTKLNNAIHFLERFTGQESEAKAAAAPARRLEDDDIRRVEQVAGQIGPRAFARAFVRSQRVVTIEPGGQGTPVVTGREFFVSMDALKKAVFPEVELRGAGHRFNQLTVALDRLLLQAFDEVNPQGLPASINMNVETVFTRSFETFLRQTRQNHLGGIAFEFRQADILQNFDEFLLARDLIVSRGGEICVDAVFTETVGIVNLVRLGIPWAKIFWRAGAEQMLMIRYEDVKYLQEYGARFTLCRVDEPAAIAIGHEVGITSFQGFHIDSLLPPA
ncbi:MAG: hypothetical protein H7841_04330 [Magnetospirillum sp. WYHS-4]